MPNISYHTRLKGHDSTKVVGGSFGGSIDKETVERLVNAHFSVFVKPSGHPVFVDRQGREVSLYLAVNPATTEKGAQALKAWRSEQARQQAALEEREQSEQDEIAELMEGLPHDEIVRRLSGKP